MMALWSSKEIAAAIDAQHTGDWNIDGVCIDSRAVTVGDLFIALEGPQFDGHDFFTEALDRGASAAMVSHIPDNAKQTINEERLITVSDTLQGLNSLAAFSRKRTTAKICAVTGSVGKTTTKEALTLILGRQGHTHATAGNLNNHWGAPLSVSRMPMQTEFGVFELGMNHAGEITPLSRLVRPHVAIVTAVEAVHMEFFNSLEEIADAKAEIFSGLEPGSTAIIPADSPHYDRLCAAALAAGAETVVSFGTDKKAAYRLIAWTITETGTRVAADVNGRRIVFEISLRGKHMALNSLAVLGGVAALGGDVEQAAGDLYDVPPPKGRGAHHVVSIDDGSFVIIDESYNASPASVSALVNTVSATRRAGRVTLALGDMLELGPQSDALHANLAVPIEAAGIDVVYTTGPNMAHLHDALPSRIEKHHAKDSEALSELLIDSVRDGDIVAVKGSFGSRMSLVVEALERMDTSTSGINQNVVNGD